MQQNRRDELLDARQETTEQTICELPFVFWQGFFTARFDELWQKHWAVALPNAKHADLQAMRTEIFDNLEKIRKLIPQACLGWRALPYPLNNDLSKQSHNEHLESPAYLSEIPPPQYEPDDYCFRTVC